jgi:hypothetical protein
MRSRRQRIGLLHSLSRMIDPDVKRMRTIYSDPPKSYADQYPAVPLPDDPLLPAIVAARWRSGGLYGEDMPGIAADLLEKGYDTPSLRRLAGETNITHSADVEPLAAKVFHELGVKYPLTENEAKLIASRQIAREVIAGRRNAWASASHLEIAIWGWTPESPELEIIFRINDEISWDSAHRRPLTALETALLDAFAALATIDILVSRTTS